MKPDALSPRNYLVSVAIVAVAVGLWALAVRLWNVPPYILPSPEVVLSRLFQDRILLLDQAKVTFTELGLGLAAGIALGACVAVLIASSRVIRQALYPLLIAQQTIPNIVIAPLLIIWCGIGLMPQVIIVMLMCFFPVAVNTARGLIDVDRTLVNLMHSYGASGLQIFLKVRVPSALPDFFTSLRLAATLSVIGAVVGEWMGAEKGLGRVVMMATNQLDTDLVFAVILILIATGMSLFSLAVVAERLAVPWSRLNGE